MKIALAQIDTLVGDPAGNAARVREWTERAREAGADLVVFPEMTLSGYPAKDLLDSPDFLAGCARALEELTAPAPWNDGIGVLVGYPEARAEGDGRRLFNACALLDGGEVRAVGRKSLLPFYDVFDEPRYFDGAASVTTVDFRGLRLGLSVCEDIWNDPTFWPRRMHDRDPVAELVEAGADVIVNLSASPFHLGRPAFRARMVAHTAAHHGVQVVMVNAVGGNDGLIFDGNSLAVAADGQVAARGAPFAEDLLFFDTARAQGPVAPPSEDEDALLDEVLDALVLGIRDYCRKTGFSRVVLGLSGGMDSALVAALAAEALGPENVLGVMMPSRYSSTHSLEDARALAANLGMPSREIPIEGPFAAFLEALEPHFGGRPRDTTEENLQARVRGVYLMALSNKLGHLLLATGNKSEVAVGYATLYGDMAGGLAPISDVVKTRVYRLAERVNARAGRELIPRNVFDKPPSAELSPGQVDQDSLPPYEVLDRIIMRYVEERWPAADIAREEGIERSVVDRVLRLLVGAEYKRRQAAPGLRVTPRAFGESWRMPLAQGHKPWAI